LRKILGLAFLAVALAFVSVQGASLVRSPQAPAPMQGETVAGTEIRYQATQSTTMSTHENLFAVVFGPLGVAALCYLFVRRRA
jgi:hypothetical protein